MQQAFFRCDLAGTTIPLVHVWEHTIGSGHAPLALRADWQDQLERCHRELGIRRVRFHGLFSDELGAVVRAPGHPPYSFFNIERIWDFLLATGMQPLVELSFMPTPLASGKKTVFRYRGNVTPPRRMQEWTDLVGCLARHATDRYGTAEVSTWNFEVWNEPNLKSFWTGSQRRYMELYRATAFALKELDPALRVGGPATAQNAWLEEFMDYCDRHGVPADFVSTHFYPTDPGRDVSPETEEQLAATRRGIMQEQASRARAAVGGLPLYYTEWNTSANERDPLHDESYAAAFVVSTLLNVAHLVDAYSFWTFSDIFEESYFPSLPFHGGFGLLTIHGIAKPVYRAFQILAQLGSELVVPVDGRHPTVECWVAREAQAINVLLANHALPRHEIRAAEVEVVLDSAASLTSARISRIDDAHCNPKRVWAEIGSPMSLSEMQLRMLHDESELATETMSHRREEASVVFRVTIPPHGVALVRIE